MDGGEKFDDVLKYIDNLQPQVLASNKIFSYSLMPFFLAQSS
jgi:hypothetical protein